MIRAACTWLLIVLAASPFTAPFSTCDVTALLGSRAATMTMMIAPPVLSSTNIAASSESGDAAAISPLVGRTVLSRDAVLVLTDWPVPPTPGAPERSRPAAVQYSRALEDSPVQLLVLRL
jgi:hypothetical protein